MYKMMGADGKEYGPITAEQLRQWIGEGRANGQTRVLPEGSPEWKMLGELPEFSQALASPLSPAAAATGVAAVAPVPRTNPLAITSLILGIVAVPFGLCCCYGF